MAPLDGSHACPLPSSTGQLGHQDHRGPRQVGDDRCHGDAHHRYSLTHLVTKRRGV